MRRFDGITVFAICLAAIQLALVVAIGNLSVAEESGGVFTFAPDEIAHIEPPPAGFYTIELEPRLDDQGKKASTSLTMPEYRDDMPIYPRAEAWSGERTYEAPELELLLGEDEAYQLYQVLVADVIGENIDAASEVRTVVGIRGASPGTFNFHGNPGNKFDDTLILLWVDGAGKRNVREFPVTTKPGPYDFGYHASSFLYPNRRYDYINDWHNEYNALHIDETDYLVRDDANKNGHWDSDRDGWWPPLTPEDHDRTGSGHNIHMGSVDAPLEEAEVVNWSAGCQTIPGMANWEIFIANAWTSMGDHVDYFLIDVRDIDPNLFSAFGQPPEDDDSTPVDDDSTAADDDLTPADDDQTPLDDDASVTNDDQTPLDDDSSTADDDASVTDDDQTPLDDDASPADDDASSDDTTLDADDDATPPDDNLDNQGSGGDAPRPIGCATDIECKGDRICVNGTCTDPVKSDAPAPQSNAGASEENSGCGCRASNTGRGWGFFSILGLGLLWALKLPREERK
jgi:MYXO-CTERM domain-containing protein